MSLLWARPGEGERPRVRITSVPYALKASDAETLGGLPARPTCWRPPPRRSEAARPTPSARPRRRWASRWRPTWCWPARRIFSQVRQRRRRGQLRRLRKRRGVGLGTATPLDRFHVRFTNTNGGLTGLAVQNLGNTNTSYSGMLFYDQNGAVAQFQGFNNVTHEYRINNVASNPSINFMLGGTSRLKIDTTVGTTISGPVGILAGGSDYRPVCYQ